MANRRFEMHQYRNVLVRMRLGESNRKIAKAGLMGRAKAGAFRELAAQNGWLDPDSPLPDEAAIAQALGSTGRATPRAGGPQGDVHELGPPGGRAPRGTFMS